LFKSTQHDTINQPPIYEAKMSLQLAAQHLSSHGRGNDSTLIHMSPREVDSLNAIAKAHGGQLTTNPSTGLPEAGFLESILPMVAGAGLTAMSGGAINPMTAGLITGGLGFAMTGSLKKGLMAGLGAYGGGSLGEALAAQGMQAAAAPELAAAQTQLSALTPDQITAYQAATEPVMSGPVFEAQNAARLAAQKTAEAQTAYGNAGFMDRLGTMGEGVKTLGKQGGFSNLYSNLGGSPMSLIKTLGSAAAPAIDEANKKKEEGEEKIDADMGQRYGFSMNPTGGQQAQQMQQGQQLQQAQLGQNPLSNTPTPTTTPFPQPDPYGREQRYFAPSYTKLTPEAATSMYGYAKGGDISSNLGDYSDGGRLLRGPGDGVSDSIPAMIGKKQPARLADGEFVVPARIVSELGNGSTEAGARKLYAMMDRIQKARGKTVGKGKVAKNSRSEKYLPA
jgi:hypothetical protein